MAKLGPGNNFTAHIYIYVYICTHIISFLGFESLGVRESRRESFAERERETELTREREREREQKKTKQQDNERERERDRGREREGMREREVLSENKTKKMRCPMMYPCKAKQHNH